MNERRPPYPGRRTKRLPREKLAPIAPPSTTLEEPPAATATALDDEEGEPVTQARCPLCMGTRMVSPEVAAAFEKLCEQAREKS